MTAITTAYIALGLIFIMSVLYFWIRFDQIVEKYPAIKKSLTRGAVISLIVFLVGIPLLVWGVESLDAFSKSEGVMIYGSFWFTVMTNIILTIATIVCIKLLLTLDNQNKKAVNNIDRTVSIEGTSIAVGVTVAMVGILLTTSEPNLVYFGLVMVVVNIASMLLMLKSEKGEK
jgi:hypothetical protein